MFCAPWIYSCGIGTDNGTTREINLQFAGGGHARRCILHSVTCRDRTLEQRRAFSLDVVLALKSTEKKTLGGRSEGAAEVTHRREKKKKRESTEYTLRILNVGTNVRMTRERKLSILSVHRRSLANDIDFIQLCGKYIFRIAKPRNYAASCRRESLEGIHGRQSSNWSHE